jgi:hypothetical protein
MANTTLVDGTTLADNALSGRGVGSIGICALSSTGALRTKPAEVAHRMSIKIREAIFSSYCDLEAI